MRNITALKLNGGYTILTIGYMAGIFFLSETPASDSNGPINSIPGFLQNMLHIPLFAGLSWCLLLSLSGGRWRQPGSFFLYGTTGIFTSVYAVLDEWHQSFVPGRCAGVGDFLLDCIGIVGLLFVHYVYVHSLKSGTILQAGKTQTEISSSELSPNSSNSLDTNQSPSDSI